jgi:endogenous inhibitor of DNA gyrase (YacG/DUF329 family)
MEGFRCLICGKAFTRKGKKRLTAKYCSMQCRGIANRGLIPKGFAGHYKKTGEYKKCLVCGKEFYVPPSLKLRRFCSIKCRNESQEYLSRFFRKEKHWNWKGGKRLVGGYVYILQPEHPNCNSGGAIAEHRLAMEKALGRYLSENEEVHHKNGIKTDNRIENLELVVKKMHLGEVRCPYCQKGFKVK